MRATRSWRKLATPTTTIDTPLNTTKTMATRLSNKGWATQGFWRMVSTPTILIHTPPTQTKMAIPQATETMATPQAPATTMATPQAPATTMGTQQRNKGWVIRGFWKMGNTITTSIMRITMSMATIRRREVLPMNFIIRTQRTPMSSTPWRSIRGSRRSTNKVKRSTSHKHLSMIN